MGATRLARLFQSVLPAEFGQVSELLPKIQNFLESNLPEEVNRCATLLTVNQQQIVIAANSPTVANYLRLHAAEISQQLRETFGLEQQLKFCALPDSLLQIDRRDTPRTPRSVSPESVASITRSAEWIEDENLKTALLSLAASLKKPD